VEKLNNQKEAIMSVLRMRGPSLPIHVAREIKVQPLFVSAFLSELKAENKIRLSEMRVGSSPIYYVEGQEEKLENYVQYLNSRERDAFELLKEKSVLMDDEQVPVMRVALRAIRDFAKGVKIRVNGESKLVWRYFMIGEDNVGEFISGRSHNKTVVPTRPPTVKKDVAEISEEKDVGSVEGAGRRNLRPALASAEGAHPPTLNSVSGESVREKMVEGVDNGKGVRRINLRPALAQGRTSAHTQRGHEDLQAGSNVAMRHPTAIAAAGGGRTTAHVFQTSRKGDPPTPNIDDGERVGGKRVVVKDVKPFEGIVAKSAEALVLTPSGHKDLQAGSKQVGKKNVPEFSGIVRKYLGANGIELVEVFSEKKREFEARVSVSGKFGEQDYYLIAKDKKNISESDLAVAVQKAQAARLLALIVSPGDLSKKGREHMGVWGNLVKFARIL